MTDGTSNANGKNTGSGSANVFKWICVAVIVVIVAGLIIVALTRPPKIPADFNKLEMTLENQRVSATEYAVWLKRNCEATAPSTLSKGDCESGLKLYIAAEAVHNALVDQLSSDLEASQERSFVYYDKEEGDADASYKSFVKWVKGRTGSMVPFQADVDPVKDSYDAFLQFWKYHDAEIAKIRGKLAADLRARAKWSSWEEIKVPATSSQ